MCVASRLELSILGASPTIRTIFKQSQADVSAELGVPSNEARLEVQILLQHCLNVNHAWLLVHENDALEANIHAAFQALLKRRLGGEPIAYILGKREFYGLEFKVTPDTLIPRPDTETLVDAALEKIPKDKPCTVLDLGTGTGAIAIAIAKHRPHAQLTAVDASLSALDVAKENAANLGVTNVEFLLSDWFSELKCKSFDIIVSNPPYIAGDDAHLKQGDLRFEPQSALASGKDGLNDIRHLITHARQHLAPQGWLMLEHGYNQSGEVAALMQDAGFGSISSFLDLSGLYRVTAGRLLP
jgi:release factor glutamine methyltransferase